MPTKEYVETLARVKAEVQQVRDAGLGYQWAMDELKAIIPTPPEVATALKAAAQKQKDLNADPNSTCLEHMKCCEENRAAIDLAWKATEEWKAKNLPKEPSPEPIEVRTLGEEYEEYRKRFHPLNSGFEIWKMEREAAYFQTAEGKKMKEEMDALDEEIRKSAEDIKAFRKTMPTITPEKYRDSLPKDYRGPAWFVQQVKQRQKERAEEEAAGVKRVEISTTKVKSKGKNS